MTPPADKRPAGPPRSGPEARPAAPQASATPLLRQTPFVIIGVAAVVHALRGAPIDAVVFAVVLVALTVEQRAVRSHPDRRPAEGVVTTTASAGTEAVAVLVGALALAAVAGLWRPYSWPLRILMALIGIGLGLLVFSRRRPARATAPARAPRTWPWSAVAVGICLQELASFVQQPDAQTGDPDHPTLSVLIDPLLGSPFVRACVLTVWLVSGYHLLRLAGLTRRAP